MLRPLKLTIAKLLTYQKRFVKYKINDINITDFFQGVHISSL
jgi:hypothetical protein